MVSLPAGSFRMGSAASEVGRSRDEGALHTVEVPAFALGKYEVTFAEWDACVDAGGCSHVPDDEGWGRGARPVMNVSWQDINGQYLPWLRQVSGQDYRLPSEAEQEYALRAGEPGRFPWGEDESVACAYANGGRSSACDDGHVFTSPVGSLQPNAFGLYDTSGNLWEWSADCWRNRYPRATTDALAFAGGADCGKRVLRGGSWDTVPAELRSADRFWDDAEYRFSVTGFRVARALVP